MRYVCIGAHLRPDDVAPVESAVALPAGGITISAYAIDDAQPTGDRELLIRVAGVRERLLDVETFIALRYGTVVTSANEAAAKCAQFLDAWRVMLEKRRGLVEMTLKLPVAGLAARPDRRDFTNGSDYLRALHAARGAARPDSQFAREAEARIAALAAEWRWRPRDEASVELVALVRRDAISRVRETGASLKAAMPEVPFLLSGPWPLETFADDES